VRAWLGLGSNLSDRLGELARAVDALRTLDARLAVSPVYETAPVGGPPGQPPYLNCVVRLEAALSPAELLAFGQRLEAAAGRVRAERFGPRTLDVDVLLVEGVTSDDPALTLPHPRMYERAFVLAPLEDLDPDLVPAGWRDRLGGTAAVAAAAVCLGDLLSSPDPPAEGTDGERSEGARR
jgi:2-amino-4-hydroxy-6-hydroxymethyldihydropteridine diphosphokinase